MDYVKEWVGKNYLGELDFFGTEPHIPPRVELLKNKDGFVRGEEAYRICLLHWGVKKRATDNLTKIIVENCLFDRKYNGSCVMGELHLLRNKIIFRPLLTVISNAIENLDYTNDNIYAAISVLDNFINYPLKSIGSDHYSVGIKEDSISIFSKIINQKDVELPEINTPERKDGNPDLRYKHAYSYIWFNERQSTLKSSAKRAKAVVEQWT